MAQPPSGSFTPIVRKGMAARYYTRLVRISKHFLWIVAAVIIGFVVWIASDSGGDNARIVFTHIAKVENLQNTMEKPHYQGVDSKERPYTVVADRATQVDKDTVALENIRGDLMFSKTSWLSLNALKGILNIPGKTMNLTGGIDVFYGDGNELRTDHAQVDMNTSSAYGDGKVEIQSSMGTLSAVGFAVEKQGAIIRFNSQVKVVIYR